MYHQMQCPSPSNRLFILNTSTTSLLRRLDSLLILRRTSSTTLKRAHESSSGLERTLHVSNSWLAEQVNCDLVAFECALERDDGLEQERVGVLEVQVHECHHSDAHHLCLVERLHLVDVVFVDRGGDEFWLFGGSHLWLIDVFEGGHVCEEMLAVMFQVYLHLAAPADVPFFLLIRKWV